ncbi:hypothetical protein [Serratia quinivorans]
MKAVSNHLDNMEEGHLFTVAHDKVSGVLESFNNISIPCPILGASAFHFDHANKKFLFLVTGEHNVITRFQ